MRKGYASLWVPLLAPLCYNTNNIFRKAYFSFGHPLAQIVDTVRYKPECRWSLGFFYDIILPVTLKLWGFTQPLTEMSTKIKAAGA